MIDDGGISAKIINQKKIGKAVLLQIRGNEIYFDLNIF